MKIKHYCIAFGISVATLLALDGYEAHATTQKVVINGQIQSVEVKESSSDNSSPVGDSEDDTTQKSTQKVIKNGEIVEVTTKNDTTQKKEVAEKPTSTTSSKLVSTPTTAAIQNSNACLFPNGSSIQWNENPLSTVIDSMATQNSLQSRIYRVACGDTLSLISIASNVPLLEIAQANGINQMDLIFSDRILYLPQQ